jgi:hypothetical protein
MSKRLLDDDARSLGTARLGKLFHDCPEEQRRDGEVVRRPLSGAEFLADGLERRRIVVIAVHVAEQAGQLVEGPGIESPVLLQTVARPRPELVELPASLGHADDRHGKVAAL